MSKNFFAVYEETYMKLDRTDEYGNAYFKGVKFQDEWLNAWLMQEVRASAPESKYFKLVYTLLWDLRPEYIPRTKRVEILDDPHRVKNFYDTKCGNHWQEHWPSFLTYEGLVSEADRYYETYSWEAIHEKIQGDR